MMFSKSLLITLLVVSVVNGAIKNYCGRDDLCKSKPFVACDATGGPGPNCPEGAYNVNLEGKHMQQILDLHNKLRNELAGGQVSGYKSAAKMATMRWNQDMADYAGLNVLTCTYGHDCHNTPEYPHAGQNIFTQSVIGNNVDYEDLSDFIEQSIKQWWSEKDQTNMSFINNCCGDIHTAHFLQMAQDNANEIGCAISRYPEKSNTKTSYLVCNYSITNIRDTPVYTSGSPASQCNSGTDQQYENLCSTSEQY